MIPASRPIAHIPLLAAFLQRQGEAVVCWGRKRSGARAREMAAKKELPWLLLEDGFLRSISLMDTSVSLVMDGTGIYYDATAPSQLETLVVQPLSPTEQARARSCFFQVFAKLFWIVRCAILYGEMFVFWLSMVSTSCLSSHMGFAPKRPDWSDLRVYLADG